MRSTNVLTYLLTDAFEMSLSCVQRGLRRHDQYVMRQLLQLATMMHADRPHSGISLQQVLH